MNLGTDALVFDARTRPIWGLWPAIDLQRARSRRGVREAGARWLRILGGSRSLDLLKEALKLLARLERAHDIKDLRSRITRAGGLIPGPLAFSGVQAIIDKLPTPLCGRVTIESEGSDQHQAIRRIGRITA